MLDSISVTAKSAVPDGRLARRKMREWHSSRTGEVRPGFPQFVEILWKSSVRSTGTR
jgi:hypothetical protein